MGQQRIRQLQKKAATPTAAPPAQKPFSWQRPFPVQEQNTLTSAPQPIPDLQARLEILRRANPDWSKVKASSNPAKAVQAKLTVGAPNDQYEQEADRVADQVMSMPDSATKQPIQREAAPEEDELQTKPLAASITPLVQRDMAPEEEEVQPKLTVDMLQREAMPEEDEIQPKLLGSIQRAAMPEEEEVQTKPLAHSIQREEMPEEEMQTKPLSNGTLQREAMPEEEEERVQAKSSGSADLQREAMPEEEEELQTKPLASPSIQREALPEEEEPLQTKSSPTPDTLHPTPSLESQLSNTQGSGSPLPDDVRSFMEPRFGADFSQVRVHTGSDAVQMNRDLNAQAFTHKQDVYFGAGKTPAKDGLTAHELTHVVQQTGAIQRVPQIQREDPDPAQDLNQKYEDAKNAGDWVKAAEYLNGFNREGILTRLGWNSTQLDAIYKGALNNPLVGSESQVARLAKVRYLDVNVKAAMKAGSWKIAAEFLNGFNSSDIITRLAKLKPEDRAQLKRGAIDGGYSEVAKQILEEPTPAEQQAQPETQGQSAGAGGAPSNYAGEYEGSGGGSDTSNRIPVSQMSKSDKISKAIDQCVKNHLGEAFKDELRQLKDSAAELVVLTIVMIAVAAASEGASLVLSAAMVGKQVSDCVNLLKGFIRKATSAQTDPDLDTAAGLLAKAIATTSINIVMAILLHKAGKAAKPYIKPPQGYVDMVTPDGQIIRVPQEAIPENTSARTQGSGEGPTQSTRTSDFTASQLAAFKRLLGKPMTDGEASVLADVWNSVANSDEAARLTLENSRGLFNNHRARFWRAVRNNESARRLFEDAGCAFGGNSSTAPSYRFSDGSLFEMTIDHIVERQTDPSLALNPNNLRIVSRRENTVLLRQLHAQDPFLKQ